ncbi:HAMP domain-containing sensor histidine kinase [Streptomyces sp. NPDC051907]|uniref:sensor histidine kinase n=1 Tax=Streptomyces sp. NPDC051907 TaxID=3155284 RepID=UPI0034438D29
MIATWVDRLPVRLRSARTRLAFVYSSLVFALAAAMVTVLYFVCGAALTRRSLADEVTRTGGVVTDGRFTAVDADPASLIPFEAAANRATLATLRELLAWSLLGLFVISVFIGRLVAGRVLAPVDRLISTARQIQATDLTRRIRHQGPDDELKRLSDTFDDMLARLDTAFRSQQRFVADASHELRNPLAVIRTNLDLALRGIPAEASVQPALQRVSRAAHRMTAIVNDLLALARWETPRQSYDLVDVAALNAQIRDDSRTLAALADVRVAGRDADDLVVLGDAEALRRAIGNLVDNAVRHAARGSTVQVSGARTVGGVHITVHNDGPPIEPADQARLFDRFWRGGSRADYPGTGLGLSIVQRVVAGHSGAVAVRSDAASGTAFTISLPPARLPRAGAPAPAPGPRKSGAPGASPA